MQRGECGGMTGERIPSLYVRAISRTFGSVESPSKTLVIRFSSIGDVVLTSPLLRVLRSRFPKSQIDFLTRKEYADLVRFNPNVNLTYEFDTSEGFAGLRRMKKTLKEEGYDLVVDLHNSIRSRFVRSMRGVKAVVVDKRIPERTLLVKFKKNSYAGIVPVADRYLETLGEYGISSDGKGAELHLPDEVLFGVASRVAKLHLNRFEHVLGICPFARHATKEWPAERYAEVGRRFVAEKAGAVMIFGGKADVPRATALSAALRSHAGSERVIDWTGELTLAESAAALQYCDVVVTNDSGLMHMAAAMQRRVVALFGSTVEEFGFFPPRNTSVVIEQKDLACRPCSHIGRDTCPEGHFRCMLDTSVESVWKAVLEMMDKADAPREKERA